MSALNQALRQALYPALLTPLLAGMHMTGGAPYVAPPIYPIVDVGGAPPTLNYAVTKFNPYYSGPAIRVVRVADNVALDIPWKGAELDLDILDAHLGATTGQVDVWYDQETGAHHATQTVAGSRPLIDSGTVSGGPLMIGGRRAIIFHGSAFLNIPSSASFNKRACWVMAAGETVASQNYLFQFGLGATRVGVLGNASGGRSRFTFNGATTPFMQQRRPCLYEAVMGASSSRFQQAHEAVTAGAIAAGTVTGGFIGETDISTGYTGNMYLTSFTVYGREPSAGERTALRASLLDLFNLYDGASNYVVFVGDSIEAASTASLHMYGDANMIPPKLSKPVHAYNFAGGGAQTQNYYSGYPASATAGGVKNLLTYYAGQNIVVCHACGTNDLQGGNRTDVQLRADTEGVCLLMRADGAKVIVSTILPATGFSAPREAYRVAYNNWLRANWPTFADGLDDRAAHPIVGAAGAPVIGSLYSDGLHVARYGYTLIEAGRRAVIETLLI